MSSTQQLSVCLQHSHFHYFLVLWIPWGSQSLQYSLTFRLQVALEGLTGVWPVADVAVGAVGAVDVVGVAFESRKQVVSLPRGY